MSDDQDFLLECDASSAQDIENALRANGVSYNYFNNIGMVSTEIVVTIILPITLSIAQILAPIIISRLKGGAKVRVFSDGDEIQIDAHDVKDLEIRLSSRR